MVSRPARNLPLVSVRGTWLRLACMLTCLLGGAGRDAIGKSPIADGYRVKWVNGRLAAIRPTEADKIFDTIGWVPNLEQALALAQQHQRPIFLFTHSGHMNHGRC